MPWIFLLLDWRSIHCALVVSLLFPNSQVGGPGSCYCGREQTETTRSRGCGCRQQRKLRPSSLIAKVWRPQTMVLWPAMRASFSLRHWAEWSSAFCSWVAFMLFFSNDRGLRPALLQSKARVIHWKSISSYRLCDPGVMMGLARHAPRLPGKPASAEKRRMGPTHPTRRAAFERSGASALWAGQLLLPPAMWQMPAVPGTSAKLCPQLFLSRHFKLSL